jgi:xylan 1,4-beta-xylosidase
MARRELGLEMVRFHGLLDDDMSISLSRGVNSWLNLDSMVDFLLSQKMRSVIELSFMPNWLANRTTTSGMQYHPNNNPPSDWTAWGELIEAVATHLVERYGIEEMSQWYFEVWNEPNSGNGHLNFGTGFWAGNMDQYFELYTITAKAIKAINTNYQVGGPSTGGGAWVDEFLDYVGSNNIPIDFLSSHHYPSLETPDR